jgi:hypothetical protein
MRQLNQHLDLGSETYLVTDTAYKTPRALGIWLQPALQRSDT